MKRWLRTVTPLQWALILSIAVHAAILSIRFVHPDAFKHVFQDNTLDIILVNAKSDERPIKAQAIAQHDLAGGGESDRKVIASTPLPATKVASAGDSAIDQNQREIADMMRRQQALILQVRKQLDALPQTAVNDSGDPRAQANQERRARLSKLLAAIEKRVQEENSRPRKRYLSPATLGATYAIYYDEMRHKIEQVGTQNFPQVAGRKLYGELLMALLVNHDGQLLDARVVRSSGDRLLDRLAEAIVAKAAPFGPFTPAMRQDTDQFDVTARFNFTHDERLETTLQTDPLTTAPPPAMPPAAAAAKP
ncbi:MAG: TonB family protein [Burkholderiaceae bacterium]|nr:MAG: TonB family protein [Burkholderiaceae bacterium]